MFNTQCHKRFPWCLLAVQIQHSLPVLKIFRGLALAHLPHLLSFPALALYWSGFCHAAVRLPFPGAGAAQRGFIEHLGSKLVRHLLWGHWLAHLCGCSCALVTLSLRYYSFLNTYFFNLGNQSEQVYTSDKAALHCPSINIFCYLV